MLRRTTDQVRVGLLVGAVAVSAFWPAMAVFAQSQDAINATLTQQVIALVERIGKIESMINAVLVALVINFIAQVVQIRRGADRKGPR